MNDANIAVLVNIIAAVESGHQVYGQRNYALYSPPYHSTPKEYTCTLGYACHYGHEAHALIQAIKDADLINFMRCDPDGLIDEALRHDWEALRWNPNKKEKACLIALIDSKVGHEVQDRIFAAKCKTMVDQCVQLYPGTAGNIKAQMMFAEIKHLGGLNPTKRIFDRLNGDFSLDAIMASLVKDQLDKTSTNQVGDKIFWSRHVKCRQFIDEYSVEESTLTEKDIIICGHGSGTPRTIRMDTYLSNRYAQKASNGKRKGIVIVRRYKYFTDEGRRKFHDTYKTILGRNTYSQSLRNYCYKKYGDGRYYSDCSSSVCLTLKEIGYDMSALNTAGIYSDSRFETVPVVIKDGHITNPEILKVGDFLEFVGNDPSRPLQIGHVEAVYEIGKAPDPGPEPQPDLKGKVKTLQEFLNVNYVHILRAAGTGQLVVDGDYGPKTRNAALAVWKYMANKYYDAALTIDNHNFANRCKAIAADITDAEVRKHYTLAEIQSGVAAGKGFADIAAFRVAKNVSLPADTWYKLFN